MTGVYIHIPFCDSKCAYCVFASFVAKEGIKEKYFDYLCEEIQRYPFNEKVDTVYFGGGTPSSVNPEQIVRVLNVLQSKFDIAGDAEITIECNPGSADKQKLAIYKKAGFNRISFGVQSLNDEMLSLIGRRHDRKRAIDAIKDAKAVGFDNISADLLLSLPKGDIEDDANVLIEHGVKHISAYMLQIEDNTPLERMVAKGAFVPKNEDETVLDYEKLAICLKEKGLQHYEISNFAFSGFESKHNSHYWTGEKYIGFGLGAHSFDGRYRRSANASGLDDYFEGKKTEELLSISERDEEIIMLGMRCKFGFDLKKLSFDLTKNTEFADLLSRNIIVNNADIITINPEYYPVSNSIIIKLTKNI